MKFILSIGTLIALAWLGIVFLLPNSRFTLVPPEEARAEALPAPDELRIQPASKDTTPQAILQPARVLGIAQEASRLHSPNTTPAEDFLILHNIMGEFRRHHDGNPVGDNDDILAALRGKNARGLRYFPDAHPQLDPTGQLLDRWGSPYFFHAVSGREMHIRSAGPDRQLFTSDDFLHKGD